MEEFIFLSEWEEEIEDEYGAGFIKGIRGYYDTGVSSKYVAKMFGTHERTVLKIWFPTNTIFEPFTKLLNLSVKGKSTKSRPSPNIQKGLRGKDDPAGSEIERLLLAGFGEHYIAEALDIARSRIQVWKVAIYGAINTSKRKDFESKIDEAKLLRSIKIYDEWKSGIPAETLLQKYQINFLSLSKILRSAERNYRKHKIKSDGFNSRKGENK